MSKACVTITILPGHSKVSQPSRSCMFTLTYFSISNNVIHKEKRNLKYFQPEWLTSMSTNQVENSLRVIAQNPYPLQLRFCHI